MKSRLTWLVILFLLPAAVPAWAKVLYDNGPINGTTDAWTINFGYVVSDTFVADGGVDGFSFGVWEFPGDTLTSVHWSITSGPLAGPIPPNALGRIFYVSGTASGINLTDKFLSTNQYGYNIDLITVTGLSVQVSYGNTYWLNLQNAVVPSGDPVYWDENSGIGCSSPGCPSQAYERAIGTIASEAFTIVGFCGSGDSGCTLGPRGSTPEPSSIVLFGSGVLGLASWLRRRLKGN